MQIAVTQTKTEHVKVGLVRQWGDYVALPGFYLWVCLSPNPIIKQKGMERGREKASGNENPKRKVEWKMFECVE